jgi:hypothetical protein
MRKSLLDENGNYIGPRATDPQAYERAKRLYQADQRDYLQLGDNRHHSVFTRIKTDEILFASGILQRSELHRDCEPGSIIDATRLCRDFLALAGVTPPPIQQPLNVVSRALGSSDFPFLLENLASRATTLGYSLAPETWPLFTKQTTTKNFKEFSRITTPELSSPPLVGENAELTHARLGADSAEKATAKSHAQLLRVSRQMIIDDQLDKIALTFNEAGRSVARAIGDDVFAILSGNPAMSDGHDLFDSSNHGNVGTGGAPSSTALDEIFKLMAAQTGPSGTVLNIRPAYILAPPAKASTLAALRRSMNSDDPRDQSTDKITTLTDSRLTGTKWYAIADPLQFSGIEVVTPITGSALRFERRQAVADDSIFFLVGGDYVAMPVDYRSMCYNAGA